jgi:hypothetical protein
MMSSSDGGNLLLERQQQEYYTFDLNEVPGSMQDTTTVAISSSGQKAKRKYTPKVAKDKRPRKPRASKVDGQEKKTNAKKVNKETAVHGHETGELSNRLFIVEKFLGDLLGFDKMVFCAINLAVELMSGRFESLDFCGWMDARG